jgi:hypothetical protein
LAKNFKQMCVRGENNEDRCDHNFFVLVIKWRACYLRACYLASDLLYFLKLWEIKWKK